MVPTETVWEIIFLWSITFIPILMLLVSIITGEIEIKQVTSKIDFVCAFASIYEMIKQISWGIVLAMLFTISSISFSVIKKRLDRHVDVGDLGVAVLKLHQMKTALCCLDQIPFAEQYRIWLRSVGNLQRTAQDIKVGYDSCGLNYSKRLYLSSRARQELNTANGLLRQGDNLLHPQDQLRGTLKFYEKKVINFIKNRSELLGIWGTGGVGKTSLLKLLVRYSREEYTDNAFQVLFVRAGTGCTVGQVQEAIATNMGLSLEHTETSQAEIIHDHLKKDTSMGLSQERKETSQAKIIHDHLKDTSFLLLLDDLWGYLDLDAIGIPWPLGTVLLSLRGGERRIQRKVVLTSRYIDFCKNMGCRNNDDTIQMKCFNEKDGWPGYDVDDVLPKILLEQPRQMARTQPPDIVGDFYPQHPQDDDDGSSEMISPYEKMRHFIEDGDAKSLLLGVWGMQGVGKTTLLRLARDSYKYKACFDHILFVGVGIGHTVNNVQNAIAVNLGLDLAKVSSLDELSRAELIFNHLEHKSFLLLLDDIRDPLSWWSIGLPLHRQQKIIFATRSQAACALMGCHVENTIEMKCLGEVDAWKLFTDKAGRYENPQVQHFAQEMVARCGGLPLALGALGRAMSNKRDPREWRCAYNQLRDKNLKPYEIDDKVCNIIFHDPLWNKTPFKPIFSSKNLDKVSPDLFVSRARSDRPRRGSALPRGGFFFSFLTEGCFNFTLPSVNARALVRYLDRALVPRRFLATLPATLEPSSSGAIPVEAGAFTFGASVNQQTRKRQRGAHSKAESVAQSQQVMAPVQPSPVQQFFPVQQQVQVQWVQQIVPVHAQPVMTTVEAPPMPAVVVAPRPSKSKRKRVDDSSENGMNKEGDEDGNDRNSRSIR